MATRQYHCPWCGAPCTASVECSLDGDTLVSTAALECGGCAASCTVVYATAVSTYVVRARKDTMALGGPFGSLRDRTAAVIAAAPKVLAQTATEKGWRTVTKSSMPPCPARAAFLGSVEWAADRGVPHFYTDCTIQFGAPFACAPPEGVVVSTNSELEPELAMWRELQRLWSAARAPDSAPLREFDVAALLEVGSGLMPHFIGDVVWLATGRAATWVVHGKCYAADV